MAKNYLNDFKLDEFKRVAAMCRDLSADQAPRWRGKSMQDRQEGLAEFVEFKDRSVRSGHRGCGHGPSTTMRAE